MRDLRDIEAAAYLAALIDGEGCVGSYRWIGRSGVTVRRRVVVISMGDKECIDRAAWAMEVLGIKNARFTKQPAAGRRRQMHGIQVTTAAGLLALAAAVPIQHVAKRKKLAAIVAELRVGCSGCGLPFDQRSAGCEVCIYRHKYRRRRGLTTVAGRTGRHPNGFTYASA